MRYDNDIPNIDVEKGVTGLKLHWLNAPPRDTAAGTTWGVPWKKGEVQACEAISLVDESGQQTALQSWPMAFWPDGSVKWTGHAAVFPETNHESLELSLNHRNIEPMLKLTIKETGAHVIIDTGKLTCIVPKKGSRLIESIKIGDKRLGTNGQLIAIKESRENTKDEKIFRQVKMISDVQNVVVEQAGPIRGVVKIQGVHRQEGGEHDQFPFTVRLYFYGGTDTIHIVHTFLYDGHPHEDFIKGLGMTFQLPLKGQPWNRHVRFAGEKGMFSEPSQLLLTRRHQNHKGRYRRQIDGQAVHFEDSDDREPLEHVTQNAIWNDFKLIQDSADHYKIIKRTGPDCSWIDAGHGHRAKGLMYAGGENGGLAVQLKDFWQKYPSTLEVSRLNDEASSMVVWFWSPETEAMDLRHYDTSTHVLSAYEGFDDMRATPVGIGNTSQINLKCFDQSPTHEELYNLAERWQSTPLLVCQPEYYHRTGVFGVWSLPDDHDPQKRLLEEQLDLALEFYMHEVEQRKWYGYWHYGDVMHTYDRVRHQWRYDLGGFAWQNTELVPNMWLWYAFLRSGRAALFDFAEAMTRHTSEVDCYHLGDYAGLGSRHNVSHWGCGCKEARISMAGLHRYYYYLTADERIGDLLRDVRDADHATVRLDPMREYVEKDAYPTHARVGPDWAAFTSNWFTEWERTGNGVYLDKITNGITCLKSMPYRLLSGPTHGYDPSNGTLYHLGDGLPGGYHMIIAFGAPQVWMELDQVLEDDTLSDMLAEFGAFYVLSDEEKRARTQGVLTDDMFSWPMFASGMVAYAAARTEDSTLAETAWSLLLDEQQSHMNLPLTTEDIETYRTFTEIPWISTNAISQWCLNMIVALELIGDKIPEGLLTEWKTSTK
ncbi:hypothetical protein [Caldalkalibacillus salinus]|uniref:exo-rhamnogalacturonan lyase family protein n=1 Tax=Caldalkalibacillus salinus TaxID=2803787 RepID=UPI001924C2FE|nr:hypothetical protein [Caldalkalibacillus salinus]